MPPAVIDMRLRNRLSEALILNGAAASHFAMKRWSLFLGRRKPQYQLWAALMAEVDESVPTLMAVIFAFVNQYPPRNGCRHWSAGLLFRELRKDSCAGLGLDAAASGQMEAKIAHRISLMPT